MKKIKVLTAIGDKYLNEKLKKEEEIEIVENDIFYKEGILEYLEKNKNIDILILYEKLPGEIELINLIKKIKLINNEIIIYFILENKNKFLENKLKNENIKNIIYINEINIEEFIEKIKNKNMKSSEKLFEEINNLKNIINIKNKELEKYKNIYLNKKIILFVGEKNVGKTTIISNINKIIKEKNKYELKEIDINNYLNIEENIFLTIFVFEINYKNIIKNKKIINKIINEKNKNIKIIFNKINNYSINKKILKNIFKNKKIIGNINLNIYCNYIFNEENNYKKQNKKLRKIYLKIIKKIEKN